MMEPRKDGTTKTRLWYGLCQWESGWDLTFTCNAMQWSKGPLWFKILCCTSYIKQIRCSPFEDMPHAQSSTNKVLKWSAVKSFLYGLSVAAVPSLSVWWGPSGCSPNYRDHTEASLAAIQTWLVLSTDRGKGPSQYIQHIYLHINVMKHLLCT